MDNEYFISGVPLKHKTDFFKHPYSSSKTVIFLSNVYLHCEEKLYEISEFKAKMICHTEMTLYLFRCYIQFDDISMKFRK